MCVCTPCVQTDERKPCLSATEPCLWLACVSSFSFPHTGKVEKLRFFFLYSIKFHFSFHPRPPWPEESNLTGYFRRKITQPCFPLLPSSTNIAFDLIAKTDLIVSLWGPFLKPFIFPELSAVFNSTEGSSFLSVLQPGFRVSCPTFPKPAIITWDRLRQSLLPPL